MVQQEDHPHFERQGDDLVVGVQISLAQALTDSKVDVPALDGRILRVPLKEVVTPGAERVVKNEGMPLSKQPGQRGNLRIKFDVRFPSRQLTGAEAAQLRALIG